jgi:hypothetical protein
MAGVVQRARTSAACAARQTAHRQRAPPIPGRSTRTQAGSAADLAGYHLGCAADRQNIRAADRRRRHHRAGPAHPRRPARQQRASRPRTSRLHPPARLSRGLRRPLAAVVGDLYHHIHLYVAGYDHTTGTDTAWAATRDGRRHYLSPTIPGTKPLKEALITNHLMRPTDGFRPLAARPATQAGRRAGRPGTARRRLRVGRPLPRRRRPQRRHDRIRERLRRWRSGYARVGIDGRSLIFGLI